MRPEEALDVARDAVAQARRDGAYRDDFSAVVINPTHDHVTSDQLMEWALIEPDSDLVTSTRRWGAPIAWLKRLLLHALRQYHGQLESQQTRFNVHLLARVVEQEERIAIIEDWLRDETPGATGFSPPAGREHPSGPLDEWPAGPASPRHGWLAPRSPGQPGLSAGTPPRRPADPDPGDAPAPGEEHP